MMKRNGPRICNYRTFNVSIPFILSNHKDLEYVARQFDVPFYWIPVLKGKKAEAVGPGEGRRRTQGRVGPDVGGQAPGETGEDMAACEFSDCQKSGEPEGAASGG